MKFFRVGITILILLFCAHVSVQGQVTVAGAAAATPNGVYPTLGAAFTAINATNQAGLAISITITANTVEGAGAVLLQNAGPWASVTIQPVGNVSVTGNLAVPLVDLNGADNVTINGVNSGGNSLTISNTSTSTVASTIRFVNDAQNNTVTNCFIRGAGTGVPTTANDGAVIFFSSTGAPGGSGNDNNIISNNDISASTTVPFVLIKGYGTTANANSNITISNNLIHDFFSTVNSHCRGIYLGSGNTAWTITGNRIYQTADRQWLSSGNNVYSCIEITNAVNGNGSNFQITNNVLGFRDAAGTGYTVLKNGGSSSTNIASNLHVIIFNATGSVNNLISGNTIGGFDLMSSRATSTANENIFIGIFIRTGTVSVTNNTIGSGSSSNSILIRSTATTAPAPVPAAGIYVRGANPVTVTGNVIGGLTFSFMSPGSTGSDRISFIGIFSDNTNQTFIRNNVIGGSNSSNIVMPYLNARLVGIQCSGGSGGGISKVTGNKIYNLVHTGVRTAFSGQNSNVVGILLAPGNVNDSIAQDTIFNLSSTASTASGNKSLVGIYVDAPAFGAGVVVSKNYIHSLTTPGGPGSITGINTSAGKTRIHNNMISVGAGQTGADIIFGIDQNLATTTEIYFNTVKVSGVSSGVNTAAYRSNCTTTFPGICTLRNNIFYNDRVGISYGLQISTFTTYTGDHNLIYGTRYGFYQGVAYLLQANWFAITGQEPLTNSINSTMTFISATDLHTNDQIIRGAGIAITGINDDIDNFVRGTCIDIGADEFDPSTIPGTVYTWTGGVNDSWCEPCNWDREVVPMPANNVIIKDKCLNYPLLQTGCGNQQVNDLTILRNISPFYSGKLDFGTYTLAVTGNVDIEGTCSCTGTSNASVTTEGLLDIISTTSQQTLNIKSSNGNYPGYLCKLRINKTAPTGVAGVNHEAILKGNLNIEYHFDITNGVLLSQNGATYDADEFTANNFKTINIFNTDPASVTRQTIGGQNTNNGFFMGRLNRNIAAGVNPGQYLFPLGFRTTGGSGVVGDYQYTPALLDFTNVTTSNYVAGTFLNNNNNGTVDGSGIGFTGHGCFNALEIDDAGGNTAVSCIGKEIDMMAQHYWDFSEGTPPASDGNPVPTAGALGAVSFDIQCSGDVYALPANDGLAGSELRLMNRANVVIPGNAGQGPWASNAGTHAGANISANTGIAMYSNALLQGARRNAVTSFGGFGAAGNGDSPLPVELLYFDAEKQKDGTVNCIWATASEINSDYFIVEVATTLDKNGNPLFSNLGTVKAAGFSTNTINYNFIDPASYNGIVYYRLTQIDYDGSAVISHIVAIRFDHNGLSFQLIGVDPNPALHESVLTVFSAGEKQIALQLTDATGRIILNRNISLSDGMNTIPLFENQKPGAGVYFLKAGDHSFSEMLRIVIL
jgi:hypothetical protein